MNGDIDSAGICRTNDISTGCVKGLQILEIKDGFVQNLDICKSSVHWTRTQRQKDSLVTAPP
jgi:hypothetical protein